MKNLTQKKWQVEISVVRLVKKNCNRQSQTWSFLVSTNNTDWTNTGETRMKIIWELIGRGVVILNTVSQSKMRSPASIMDWKTNQVNLRLVSNLFYTYVLKVFEICMFFITKKNRLQRLYPDSSPYGENCQAIYKCSMNGKMKK